VPRSPDGPGSSRSRQAHRQPRPASPAHTGAGAGWWLRPGAAAGHRSRGPAAAPPGFPWIAAGPHPSATHFASSPWVCLLLRACLLLLVLFGSSFHFYLYITFFGRLVKTF